jgi:hypothetical protein
MSSTSPYSCVKYAAWGRLGQLTSICDYMYWNLSSERLTVLRPATLLALIGRFPVLLHDFTFTTGIYFLFSCMALHLQPASISCSPAWLYIYNRHLLACPKKIPCCYATWMFMSVSTRSQYCNIRSQLNPLQIVNSFNIILPSALGVPFCRLRIYFAPEIL